MPDGLNHGAPQTATRWPCKMAKARSWLVAVVIAAASTAANELSSTFVVESESKPAQDEGPCPLEIFFPDNGFVFEMSEQIILKLRPSKREMCRVW